MKKCTMDGTMYLFKCFIISETLQVDLVRTFYQLTSFAVKCSPTYCVIKLLVDIEVSRSCVINASPIEDRVFFC